MAIDSREVHQQNFLPALQTWGSRPFSRSCCGRLTEVLQTMSPVILSWVCVLPPASIMWRKKLDMGSDVIRAVFPSQFSDVRSTVPVNSIVSSYDIHSPVQITSAISSSSVSTIVENGMSDIDDTKRDLLAIGGISFDPRPFMLRSTPSHEETGNVRHIIPSKTSRIAVLQLPELSTYNYFTLYNYHAMLLI